MLLGWREQVDKDTVKAGVLGVEASNRYEWQRGVFRFLSQVGKR